MYSCCASVGDTSSREDELAINLGSPASTSCPAESLRCLLPSGTGLPRPLIPNLEPSVRGLQPHTANTPSGTSTVLRMRVVGANPVAKAKGEEELPGKANYFIGNDPHKWRTNVPTYAKVKYQGVYPGVDLVFYGNQRQLEHDFVVAPAADASRIELRLEGSKRLSLDAEGNLDIAVESGEVHLRKPLIYQVGSGGRREIPGGYVLNGARELAFKVGAYDHSKPLVIDPVLTYSTYLGGSGHDQTGRVTVDSRGNAYVTGGTNSADFPTTPEAFQTRLVVGAYNAFVTKLNPAGSALVYSTYLGGSVFDVGEGIAVDSMGNAYVTGLTQSSDFPTTPTAFQTALAGSSNAFVTKLSPSGSALVYSTYLGGAGAYSGYSGLGFAITVDRLGDTFVTGWTESTSFPTTPGAFQTALAGSQNAFVTKLNPSGSALAYSTYLGGSNVEYCYGVAIDSSGSAYAEGETTSANFPTTAGAFQTTLAGPQNTFVTKFSPDGSALAYSTYLGGSGEDFGGGIAVDSSGNAYVTGTAGSSNFPTTPEAFQTTLAGAQNAFVTKLNPSGSALVYSTYLGGSRADGGNGASVDSSGNAYVVGDACSSDFPTTPDAFQTSLKACPGAFVTKLNPAGTALTYSTRIRRLMCTVPCLIR